MLKKKEKNMKLSIALKNFGINKNMTYLRKKKVSVISINIDKYIKKALNKKSSIEKDILRQFMKNKVYYMPRFHIVSICITVANINHLFIWILTKSSPRFNDRINIQ